MMEEKGFVICICSNCYGFFEKMNLICGKLIGYVCGFVFVVLDEKKMGDDDFFILFIELNGVFYGDIVLVCFSF